MLKPHHFCYALITICYFTNTAFVIKIFLTVFFFQADKPIYTIYKGGYLLSYELCRRIFKAS